MLIFTGLLAAGACSDDDDETSRYASYDDDENDDDTEDESSKRCAVVLQFLYYQCGAQFLNEDGDTISYTTMIKHCDAPVVKCIVECGEDSVDCTAIQTCLEEDCALL